MSADQVEPQVSQNKDLKPWEIVIEKSDEKEILQQKKEAVNQWLKQLQEDVSGLLSKNGITVYQITILHPGTRSPMFILSGNNYVTGKLAKAAYLELRGRVAEEFAVDNDL